ncbi:MAG TPA: FtsX-like permease family protein, partial [Acidimicrobiales bacterium]
MLRTTFKGISAHKRRLLSTSSAVLLGVAFLCGTLILGDTLRAGFADLFTEANAGTDAVVRSSTEVGDDEVSERGLLDASVVDTVRGVDGVATAEPLIEGTGQIVGADGDPLGGNGPPTVAGNWVADRGLNPYELDRGEAPRRDGEVVIDEASAEEGDLHIGDTTTICTPEPIEVTIVGLVRFGDAESAGPVTYAGFTADYAERILLPAPGSVTSVLVAADPGVSQAELVDRLEPVLPDGAEALTGAELTQEQRDAIESDFLGFFTAFITAFAVVAMVVATFSIYNTFSILVAQRTRESALLRALGASRRQVLTSVGIEALVIGVVASGVGVAVGLALASGLLALTTALGLGEIADGLTVHAGSMVVAAVVGVVATLIASVAPAVKASRVRPLAALRDVAVDRSGASVVRGVSGVLL